MPDTREIDLGEVRLVIDEAGAGGMPLLLLHGFTGERADFETVTGPLVERGWHVVIPDQRGHGDSSQPAGEEHYSLEGFARDALALATAVGWDRFTLLGHSMGGMIAQHVVRLAPERVNALVLLDTTHETVEMDADIVALGLQVARNEGLAQLVELSRQYDDPLETPAHRRLCAEVPGYRERGDNATIRSSPAMYAALGVEITSPHDRLADLAGVSCPTLVIVGEQDIPMIAPSERMAATIPGATLAVVAGGGHSPQFEATDGLLGALLPFLDRVAAGALVAEA